MKCADPIAALAALTLTAPASHAAQDRPDGASVKTAAVQLTTPGCEGGAPEAKRFVVPKAYGGTRTMEICNGEGGRDPEGTARALSEAIDAARDNDKFYIHSRMPDLLVLRVTRARIEVDPSLTTGERMKRLTAINDEISELECQISESAQAR